MAKKKAVEGEVVDALAVAGGELSGAEGWGAETTQLKAFLADVAVFFGKARAIEKGAEDCLKMAKAMPKPTTEEADVKVQRALVDVLRDIKVAEEHWKITTVISQVHRRFTAARGRVVGTDSKNAPTGLLNQARAILQANHNSYVQEQHQAQKREQERLWREAEDKARLAREAELAELEAEALKLEANSPKLSEREQVFVGYLLAGQAPQAAAKLAGFKDPAVRGVLLDQSPKIQQALEAARAAVQIREQAKAIEEEPLEALDVADVRAAVTRYGGLSDRTTHSAELFDEEALIAAILDPRTRVSLGIPAALLTIKQSVLNTEARAVGEQINRWPGVRLKKNTITV